MSYLIDGNNVMAQRVGWHKDKAAARRRLLEDLVRFAASHGARIAVVFDGAPDDSFPDGSSYGGVQIFYARLGSDADARIKEIVEASRERRTLRVVTSDRALADYVRRCGAPVERSGDFCQRMDAKNAAGERESKTAPPSLERERGAVRPAEMTEWMRYFGVDADDE